MYVDNTRNVVFGVLPHILSYMSVARVGLPLFCSNILKTRYSISVRYILLPLFVGKVGMS
jgi:hypothetical protein